MAGEGGRRLCDACRTEVTDLSSLTASDAARLLDAEAAGPRCVRVTHDGSGRIHFAPGGGATRIVLTLAVGASLALACDGPPAREHAHAVDAASGEQPAVATPSVPLAQKAPAFPLPLAKPAPPLRAALHVTMGCVCQPGDPLCSCL
jgi:hypothetical protein